MIQAILSSHPFIPQRHNIRYQQFYFYSKKSHSKQVLLLFYKNAKPHQSKMTEFPHGIGMQTWNLLILTPLQDYPNPTGHDGTKKCDVKNKIVEKEKEKKCKNRKFNRF
jgi:hypothetical protein